MKRESEHFTLVEANPISDDMDDQLGKPERTHGGLGAWSVSTSIFVAR